jgi:hypothetical protein
LSERRKNKEGAGSHQQRKELRSKKGKKGKKKKKKEKGKRKERQQVKGNQFSAL